jgi:hypothetical protein
MGAINKLNNTYEYPKIANKKNKYKCPECEKDVIFRNGKINQPHFAHYKSDNPCTYYEQQGESQIHKEGKMIMKYFLDNKKYIYIYRKCYYCNDDAEVLFISDEDYTDEMKAVIEYKFNFNDSLKSADVALIENNKLIYIFEICYKNKTKEENRPEPWFEIKAETLIKHTNSGENINENEEIKIECIRDYKCDCCKGKEDYERKRQRDLSEKIKKKEKEQQLEKRELFLMNKEDYRTIEIQLKMELEKENLRKLMERERKLKLQEEKLEIKRKKEEEEREIERIKQLEDENNKKCNSCNINYCKCNNPSFIKMYNKLMCNFCKKYKCKCIKITNYFKLNK